MSGEDSQVKVTVSNMDDDDEEDGGQADKNEELDIREEDPLEMMMQRNEPSTHSQVSRQPPTHRNN